MKANIFSTNKIVYQDRFSSIILPTSIGEISVLQNHAPLITPLKKGKIRIKDNKQKEFCIEIEQGILEVNPKEANMLITLKQ